jgi:membrane protein CcdC involved in cytochrome C biogenesis
MQQAMLALAGAMVLVLIGWRLRGRQMLAATAFGLALAVIVVWLDREGLWPSGWRR